MTRDTSAWEAYGILRARGRSAKHKMSHLANAYGSMDLGKGKKRDQRSPYCAGPLCAEAGEGNFSFVNESSRRLLSRCAPRWNRGRGALRSFALTTRVKV